MACGARREAPEPERATSSTTTCSALQTPSCAPSASARYQLLDDHFHFTVTTDATHPPRGTDGAGMRDEIIRTTRDLARAFVSEPTARAKM